MCIRTILPTWSGGPSCMTVNVSTSHNTQLEDVHSSTRHRVSAGARLSQSGLMMLSSWQAREMSILTQPWHLWLPSHGPDCSSVAGSIAASAELAGDLSDNVETFTSTLRCFGAKYKHCFYTPGNHCLWVRNGEEKLRNSLGEQLGTALAVCEPAVPQLL